jgi:hypothetical protein
MRNSPTWRWWGAAGPSRAEELSMDNVISKELFQQQLEAER